MGRAWPVSRVKYELNRINFTARQVRLGNLLMTKVMGPSRLHPGSDANKFAMNPFDFLLDGYLYHFPGADDIALPGASTTASQYRKILISCAAGASHELQGNRVIGGDWVITDATAVTLTGAGSVTFMIHGEIYKYILDTTITLTDDGDVSGGKWRAWRIEIDKDGTVTATADGASQHDEEDTALMGLASVAPDPDKVTLGYFTIDSNGGYAVGDVNVDGETAQWLYLVRGDRGFSNRVLLTAAIPMVLDDDATTFDVGLVNAMTLGNRNTELSAQSNVAGDDDGADLISTKKYGVWILVYQAGAATNDTYLLSAGGQELDDGVSTQAYTTAAAALAAANVLIARLPEMLVPIALLTVYNGTTGNFVIGTTKWDATDIVSAIVAVDIPFTEHVTTTTGVVTTTQALAKIPDCPDDECPVGVIELGISFTDDTTDLTEAMCMEMDLSNYHECFKKDGS